MKASTYVTTVALLISLTAVASGAGQTTPQPTAPKPAAKAAPAPPTSSPVNKAQLATEIQATEAAIKAAEDESARYAGGLVKSLIDVRLATLRQTRAMLAQRSAATDFNVAVRYSVTGRTLPTENPAAEIESIARDIASTKTKIEQQETEAARYSGGLTQAMSLATVATSKHTLAMLEQKRLALRYGLPQFIGFADAYTAPAPAAGTAPGASPRQTSRNAPAERQWEIVSVDSRVTEQNDTWWKFAWKLTLRNTGTSAVTLRGKVEFQDADGFVVDDDDTDMMMVPAGGEQTFTGYDLVTTSSARKVSSTTAKVGEAR